jgi:two-component system cell cycle sensor histidine kinase/response regulator CckA
VLLVEDEPAVRRLCVRYLRDCGYRILEAASIDEAIAAVGSTARPIDILVTDVVMPGGSGPQLATTLRDLHGDLPVLYLSGYPHIGQAHEDGKIDAPLLQKPFSAEQLTSAVRDLLDSTISQRTGAAT